MGWVEGNERRVGSGLDEEMDNGRFMPGKGKGGGGELGLGYLFTT